LPLHADRLRDLLGEACFVETEYCVFIAPMCGGVLTQLAEHNAVVPHGLPDELLQRTDHAACQLLGDVLYVATLTTGQQPLHELLGMLPLLHLAEQLEETLENTSNSGRSRRNARASMLRLLKPSTTRAPIN
jgi:hypothetical protein